MALAEVVELLDAAEAKAMYGLAINWRALQALTQALLDRGTITVGRRRGGDGGKGGLGEEEVQEAEDGEEVEWGRRRNGGGPTGEEQEEESQGAGATGCVQEECARVYNMGSLMSCLAGALARALLIGCPVCERRTRACRARRWRTSWSPTASSTSPTPTPLASVGTPMVSGLSGSWCRRLSAAAIQFLITPTQQLHPVEV